MKKMMMALAFMITIGATTAFANEHEISSKVLEAFKTEFTTAKDVSWTAGNDFYKADFTINSQKVFAFYSLEGEFIGLTRYISSLQLPLQLQANLKKNYNGLWISDLFEMTNNNETTYYITLESADTKIILKSSNAASWSTYQKLKKA